MAFSRYSISLANTSRLPEDIRVTFSGEVAHIWRRF